MIKFSEESMSKAETSWKLGLLHQTVKWNRACKWKVLEANKKSYLVNTQMIRNHNRLIADVESFRGLVCTWSHVSRVWLFATLWTIVHQTPLSTGILQARVLEGLSSPFSRGSSLLHNPAISLLCIYLKKNYSSKRYIQPNVHNRTIYNSHDFQET